MSTPTDAIDFTTFDVRTIPCRVKHGLIFQRWATLPVGDHFVLVNDHDPVPLYYQFAAQFPGAFSWEYLPPTADEFRVKITRLAPSPTAAITPPPPPPRPAAPAGAASPAVDEVDARGLEPPEPMLRILDAIERLPAGGTLRALTDRKPIHLLPELDARGIRHSSEEVCDGSWITTLSRN